MPSDGDADPDLEKGFTEVDVQPDPAFLVAGMEATASFPAVHRLRAWERERLDLRPGDALLDVGCGIGDVARSLAPRVQPGGRVLGIDASEVMLGVARERAGTDGVEAEFRTGDALALGEADASFDAVRSERMLQWLPDIHPAIVEMVRVLRPGGRISLIDSDWRTLTADVGDYEATDAVVRALVAYRGDSSSAGGRLLNECRDARLENLEHEAATHVWSAWDPDVEPAPAGLFPLDTAIPQLVDLELLDREIADRWIELVYDRARRGRFCMTLTMIAVTARKP